MNQFKRAQTILLTSIKTSNIHKNKHGKLFYSHEETSYSDCINQELYIISDDEIKDGDWFINLLDNSIYQATNWIYVSTCKKIIATTDTSLKRAVPQLQLGEKFNDYYPLPQPSQQFIEKYIQYYNKDEVITDVLVEYELLGHEEIPSKFWEERLKINPKDNTITIKKLKDSWNREEVIFLLKKFNRDIAGLCNKDDNWIEKNL